MNARNLSLLSLAACLAACASAPQDTRHYLLAGSGKPEAMCNVRVGTVTVPGYLKRTNMAVQGNGNELLYADRHRWAEPLTDGVRRALRACLGNAQSPVVHVLIEHFHGSIAGETVLSAAWQMEGAPAAELHHDSAQQRAAGYDAMVDSQRALVVNLCRRICDGAEQVKAPLQP
jgi:uncharacterized lipoprotein YmbA